VRDGCAIETRRRQVIGHRTVIVDADHETSMPTHPPVPAPRWVKKLGLVQLELFAVLTAACARVSLAYNLGTAGRVKSASG